MALKGRGRRCWSRPHGRQRLHRLDARPPPPRPRLQRPRRRPQPRSERNNAMVVCFGCGGYQVRRWRADDKAETDHLLALAAGAGEGRLSIFRCDLFDGAALLDAARGCPGVFHLASPCIIDAKQLMVPAVEGTLNVLRAAKEAGGVRRVVVTSSISAIVPSPGWPAGEVRDERCWTDVDYCEENGVPQG
uniref:3-beta hydroxysteroid dehydrogenase/isomerase domain-containing protein n=1 Tax=Setaria viridis TaxID=4556 RepID=A0A4U6STT2_SETVI|nr:hypothetical protein SEVIR_9G035400v2 [Setaria viridis]